MAKWAGGGGVRWGEREGSRMRENRMFFFKKKRKSRRRRSGRGDGCREMD